MSPGDAAREGKAGARPRAAGAERNATLDILRGLALLGMILVHVLDGLVDGRNATLLESGVSRFVLLMVDDKDRTIFSFLFGVGCALNMRRLDAAGLSVRAFMLRRLFVLFLVGFAVDTLTRFSILREYAWWGVPLLFLRSFPTRTLLAIALISAMAYSIRDFSDTGWSLLTKGRERVVSADQAYLRQLETDRERREGRTTAASYTEVVVERAGRVVRQYWGSIPFTPNVYLALFLLGLLAVRHGILADPLTHRRLLLAIAGVGALLWAVHWWVLPLIPEDLGTPLLALRLREGLGIVDDQCLAFAYLGLLTLLLASRPQWQRRMALFGWAGRMAFTNYLLHAALLEYAVSPFGLGLQLRPFAGLLFVAALFALQSWGSKIWLSHFRFGPFEWIWRSLSYWRLQPMRVSPRSSIP